jgi:O-antigen/teichoic acid export membrane protein
VAVMTPTSIVVLAVTGPFLPFWLGEAFATEVYPIAVILLAGVWANSSPRSPMFRMQGQGGQTCPPSCRFCT